MDSASLRTWLRVRRDNAAVSSLFNVARVSYVTSDPKGDRTLHCLKPDTHNPTFWPEQGPVSEVWQRIEAAQPLSKKADIDDDEVRQGEDLGGGNQVAATLLSVRQACRQGDLRLLKRLLRSGVADVTRTLLLDVVRDGNPAGLELLLLLGLEADPDFPGHFLEWCTGATATAAGSPTSHSDSAKAQDPPQLPLHMACHRGCREVCLVLLTFARQHLHSRPARAAVTNARDLAGRLPAVSRSALHLASWTRQHFRAQAWQTMRDLIAHGAEVNSQDNRGRSPLHAACRAADAIAVQVLLKAGADPALEDNMGLSPLEVAREEQRLLLEQAMRRALDPVRHLRLHSRLLARTAWSNVVTDVSARRGGLCPLGCGRSACACLSKRRRDFPHWLYSHGRWPRAGQGSSGAPTGGAAAGAQAAAAVGGGEVAVDTWGD